MFVGTISLRLPASEPNPSTSDSRLGILGYAVGRDHQGNGFASEAAASVAELVRHRVTAAHHGSETHSCSNAPTGSALALDSWCC